MKKLLLPIVLLLVGTGAGVGAGIMLKPAPEEEVAHAADCGPTEHIADADMTVPVAATPAQEEVEYAEMTNQFVVPVLANDEVAAMVVMSLSIEVPLGQTDAVFAVEPKLRDGFLRVMFNHANVGGFSGNFTANSNMGILRGDLLRSAQEVLGEAALDILVLDIVRQQV